MKRAVLLVLVTLVTLSLAWKTHQEQADDRLLWDVVHDLGQDYPEYYGDYLTDSAYVNRGKEIFFKGRARTMDGELGSYQSIHYTCSSCHNSQREDPYLRHSNPDTRLDYAIANDLAFLQGTTMYGTLNRTSWYNDDYVKKYGDLVKPANKDVKEAVKLCSVECSQGRYLNEWEMKAMMAYLWSISLRVSDLALDEKYVGWASEAKKLGKTEQEELLTAIEASYLPASPATFLEVVGDKKEGYGLEGNVARGGEIYRRSCMTCHSADHAESSNYLVLENNALSLNMLKRNITKNGKKSIYYILRHGTYAQFGHKPYMPHYTKERMSNQQVEDLRAFLEKGDPSL